MAVTCGFFNSLNHDRQYNAEQMAHLFDGIINDGVFQSIGNKFSTIPGTGMQVMVQSGKAWFNHTWTENDANLPITVAPADTYLNRIDAVVLEVNHNNSVRKNTIKIIQGTPSSNPILPSLRPSTDEQLSHHLLAKITVKANATSISTADIEIRVGHEETPYVTGLVQVTSVEQLYAQWKAQFEGDLDSWEAEFREWFDELQLILNEEVITNLQKQINDNKQEFDEYKTEADKKFVKKVEDKASEEEAAKGISDDKYITPKKMQNGISGFLSTKVNDKTFKLGVRSAPTFMYREAPGPWGNSPAFGVHAPFNSHGHNQALIAAVYNLKLGKYLEFYTDYEGDGSTDTTYKNAKVAITKGDIKSSDAPTLVGCLKIGDDFDMVKNISNNNGAASLTSVGTLNLSIYPSGQSSVDRLIFDSSKDNFIVRALNSDLLALIDTVNMNIYDFSNISNAYITYLSSCFYYITKNKIYIIYSSSNSVSRVTVIDRLDIHGKTDQYKKYITDDFNTQYTNSISLANDSKYMPRDLSFISYSSDTIYFRTTATQLTSLTYTDNAFNSKNITINSALSTTVYYLNGDYENTYYFVDFFTSTFSKIIKMHIDNTTATLEEYNIKNLLSENIQTIIPLGLVGNGKTDLYFICGITRQYGEVLKNNLGARDTQPILSVMFFENGNLNEKPVISTFSSTDESNNRLFIFDGRGLYFQYNTNLKVYEVGNNDTAPSYSGSINVSDYASAVFDTTKTLQRSISAKTRFVKICLQQFYNIIDLENNTVFIPKTRISTNYPNLPSGFAGNIDSKYDVYRSLGNISMAQFFENIIVIDEKGNTELTHFYCTCPKNIRYFSPNLSIQVNKTPYYMPGQSLIPSKVIFTSVSNVPLAYADTFGVESVYNPARPTLSADDYLEATTEES